MSNIGPEGRSFLSITSDDIKRLASIAKKDRDEFFSTHSDWAVLYSNRFLCSALCQGAALHYVFGKVGINDFDIYNLYVHNPKKNWYAKRIKSYDFGDQKFGKSLDHPEFVGRRVDVLGRALQVDITTDPVIAIQRYLSSGLTTTARLLSQKAVVLLEPLNRAGEIVWPLSLRKK